MQQSGVPSAEVLTHIPCDLPYCLTLRLSVCILSSSRTSCGLTRSRWTLKINMILKCKTLQLKPSQFHSLGYPLSHPGKRVQGFQRLGHMLSFEKVHISIAKWEVSLRGRDVNCLQSQSLVTMSAKHHTGLLRSAGILVQQLRHPSCVIIQPAVLKQTESSQPKTQPKQVCIWLQKIL